MRSLLAFLALLAGGAGAAELDRADLIWANWDRLQTCHAAEYYVPENTTALVEVVRRARADGRQVKVVGAGHSFSPIALLDDDAKRAGYIVSMDALNEVLAIDGGRLEARVQAGIRIHDLNDALFAAGYAMNNLGAIAEQSLAGATQTGTHGTGRGIQSLSGAIRGLTILQADGTIVTADATTNADLYNAARVGLGALGLVMEITVSIRPVFKLKRTQVPYDLTELRAALPTLRKQYDRMQWFYTPHTQDATLLLREEVDVDAPITPCWTDPETPERARAVYHPVFGWVGNDGAPGPNQTCQDWSYKALTRQKDHAELYTEMEYFVPVEFEDQVVTEFLEYQESIRTTAGRLCNDRVLGSCSLFTGVRYVAADDIWLSPMYKRDIAVVSFIAHGEPGKSAPPVIFAAYARGLARIAQRYGGRPHWGKMNWATAAYLRPQYPQFDAFGELRARMDREGMFYNAYLERTLGDAHGRLGA